MPKHVTNIKYPFQDSWNKEMNFMTLDLQNVDNTYANAIRRIVLTDLKSIGFKTRPYNESDINFIINETPMDNQKLSHRIGLIPIHVKNPELFDIHDYQFYINKENNSNETIEVTSEDFKIKQLSKNKDLPREEVKKFFPPNPLTNEYVFICYLLPVKSGSDESGGKIYFTARTSLKTAREDAKYNIAQCSFKNKEDPTKVEEAFLKYFEDEHQINGESMEVLRNRFNITEAQRYFSVDDWGYPNSFEFEVEAYNTIKPIVCFYKAMEILGNKLTNFINNIKANNTEKVEIKNSETDMSAFDIIIQKETYTLVALLQSHILRNYVEHKNLVKFVGFIKPHPLKNNVVLRVALEDGQHNLDNLRKLLDKATNELIKLNNDVMNNIQKQKHVMEYLNDMSQVKKDKNNDEE